VKKEKYFVRDFMIAFIPVLRWGLIMKLELVPLILGFKTEIWRMKSITPHIVYLALSSEVKLG
jgi:hypothetical protein